MTLSALIYRATNLKNQYGDMVVTMPNGEPVESVGFEPAAVSNSNYPVLGMIPYNRAVINGGKTVMSYGNMGVTGMTNL